MITKELLKEKIDCLSEIELEKVYHYLSSLTEENKKKPKIRALKLNGKLDKKNIQFIAYE